jgi:hypothetical protein
VISPFEFTGSGADRQPINGHHFTGLSLSVVIQRATTAHRQRDAPSLMQLSVTLTW